MTNTRTLRNSHSRKALRALEIAKAAQKYTIMASPPTITKGTNGANSTVVTDATQYAPTYLPDNAAFTPLACSIPVGVSGNYGPTFITETNASRSQGWGIGFWTDAEAIDVLFRDNANSKFRVRVDGQWATAGDSDTSASGANFVYNKIDFGTGNGVPRWIELFFSVSVQVRGICAGFSAGSTAANNKFKVWLGADTSPMRWMFYGDSYIYGTGPTTNVVRNGLVYTCGEYMGIANPIGSGAGGQGYLSASNGSALTARGRIADVSTFGALDVMVVSFGINDYNQPAATLQAEVTTTIAEIMLAQPDALIFGTFFSASAKTVGSTQAAAIKAGFLAAYDSNRMAFLDGSTFTGNSRQDTSGGNSTIYQNADNVHPNDLGHVYLGRHLAGEIQAALVTIAAL